MKLLIIELVHAVLICPFTLNAESNNRDSISTAFRHEYAMKFFMDFSSWKRNGEAKTYKWKNLASWFTWREQNGRFKVVFRDQLL